jgi:hypothetical protein
MMNNSELQVDWEIAVVLDSRPRVILIPKDALAFDFLGDHFEDLGLGYDNGFYDFLRGRNGEITGIRYFPSLDADHALREVVEGEDIGRPLDGNMPILQIFWDPDHTVDPEAPCDQYFGNNFIYRSKHSGKLAIGFAVDALPDQERDQLKQMTAR